MSKLIFLCAICASVALISTLRLRASHILQSSPRHQLSSSGMQGLKTTEPGGDSRTTDFRDYLRATGFAENDDDIDSYPRMSAFDGSNKIVLEPLHVCQRKAPILPDTDMAITRKYARCHLLNRPPNEIKILLLKGVESWGRTGNNLIEILHSLQYGRDNDVLVAIMWGSWPFYSLQDMWMAIRADSDANRVAYKEFFEQAFCVKILHDPTEAEQYKEVIEMDTRELYEYKHHGLINQYAEFQGHILRTLYRFSNDGSGINMKRKPVEDMCSVLDTMFGIDKRSTVYSVIHSRSLEGDPGKRLLGHISKKGRDANGIGCDRTAALDMEPEYIKAILEPLGMLDKPIVFITDHQRPRIQEKLLADPDIGPNIQLIPEEASWVGGDVTVAVMADVFIGNPASTFSGFIAKSRVALGYDTNYLFRRMNDAGVWVDVCDHRCIFDTRVMGAMA
ncbi:hypothetical protein ACHAXR_008894 [Thalassiosira sp. AJA248-18]